MEFTHLEYKERNMMIWNEIAPRYHNKWASVGKGPFHSTKKLVEMANIKKGEMVLDVACGTGAVIKEIRKKIGSLGYVIGIDTSRVAIRIAKKWNGGKKNISFVNIDAEKFIFYKKFDVITCQYALFFFPVAQRALKNMRQSLKKTGRIGISVHGSKDKVPFFGIILDAITQYIPDYVPPGSPNLDRFSTKSALYSEVKRAGFSKVLVKEFVFQYSPGKFDDYWRDYLRYVAKPLREKINELDRLKRKELKYLVKENTLQYTKNDGKILFPWQVLILTAKY